MADQFKEAVCVDAGRVYDSCCDRDCLEDMRLFFNAQDQALVNQATAVRGRSAQLLTCLVGVEPITFNRGYYAVDSVFYFKVDLDAYHAASTRPDPVSGICSFTKKVILFGSEGNAKVFTSDAPMSEAKQLLPAANNNPSAVVQTVDPVMLSAAVYPCGEAGCAGTMNAPQAVLDEIGGALAPAEAVEQWVAATLGIFTVVQLVRNVQMLMPVYDFCVPNKECVSTTDDPCAIFNRLQFPVDEFFPPRELSEEEGNTCGACNPGQRTN